MQETYNLSDGTFTAPINDTYNFSMAALNLFYLYVNNMKVNLGICLCDDAHSAGIDLVIGREFVMLTLNFKDKVTVMPQAGRIPIITKQDELANFQGFLCSPICGNRVT